VRWLPVFTGLKQGPKFFPFFAHEEAPRRVLLELPDQRVRIEFTAAASVPGCLLLRNFRRESVQARRPTGVEEQSFSQFVNIVDVDIVRILDKAGEVLDMGPLGPVEFKRHDDIMVRQEFLDVISWIIPF